jgi:Concanavalin A-like lectin/glucanases superfamily/Bacterial Ig domain/Immunoglobulin domain/Immunoglobulin I-set domain
MRTWICFALSTLALQLPAQNIVVNGSFETFGTNIVGWSSTEGWSWAGATTTAADGQAFVFLSGNLYQDLPTVPGQVYRLRYALAGNPVFQGPTPLQTFWAGNLIATTVFDTTGHSNENLGWIYVTNNLLATAATTRLWFANPNYGTSVIPDLDAVSAIPVNELPTTCIAVPAGIISSWKGENNALDTTDGNNGTLVIGTSFTNGLLGQAFYFAGSNQCVQIAYSTNLAATNYSIEAWVQPLAQITDSNTQAVLFAQNNGQCQLLARAGVSGLRVALQFAVDPSTSVSVESAGELAIGQFSHVAGTWDGSTLRLYINGALDAQRTPGFVPFDSGCPFYIGGIYNLSSGSCSNVGGFFNGIIDEVSYYRRALSDSEIDFIFHAGSLGKCGIAHPPTFLVQPVNKTVYAGSTVTFTAGATGDVPIGYQWQFNGANLSGQTTISLTLTNVGFANAGNYSLQAINAAGSTSSSNALLTVLPAPPCVTVTNGLISWWRAETNLFDGWDSNDGAPLSSGPPFTFIPFIPGKVGLAFNIYSNGVFVTDNPSLRLTNNLTIEGWVSPSNFSGSTLRTIFSKFDAPVGTPTNSSYYLGVSNSFLLFKVSANGHTAVSLTTSVPLQLAQWSHVAATYDGSALRLYLNGVPVAQMSYSAGIFPGTSDVGIGAIPYQQNTWYSLWSGGVDEISVYNRALSDNEILGIYNADLTGKCLAAPMIALQPQNVVVPLNEDAIFSAKVLGTKPLRYQWRFNGINIPGAFGSRLALEHVQSNNIGNYSFVVTNTVGRATSSVATLTLLPPLSCVSAPNGMIAWWPANNFGNDVIGTNFMTLSSGPFPIGFAGYATGKVGRCFILSNAVASAANAAELNIGSNADFSIELWYKGSPTNAIGGFQTTSGTAILRKTTLSPLPPTSSSGYSLLLDDHGRLICQLAKLPNAGTNIPTFTAPGSDIRDELFHHLAFTLHRNSADGGRLYVDGQLALAFDTTFLGNFSLSNSAALVLGEASALGRLGEPAQRIDELTMYNRALSPAEILSIYHAGSAGKCIPAPSILVQPTNQLVQAGNTAALRVVANGFPPLSYQWVKNGLNLPNATNSTLSLSNVTIADAATYSVFVSNSGGVRVSDLVTLTVNRPPVASNLNAATIQNSPINIPVEKLLFFASDPDADPVALAYVVTPTANGGAVTRGTTDVTYTPPNGFIGGDNFTYSVSDGRGGSGSALVIVQVRSANDPSGNLLPLTPIAGGFSVSFAGIPGRPYTLQRAEAVTGPWSNLASVIVGPTGIGIFDDTNSPPPTAFYRTAYP